MYCVDIPIYVTHYDNGIEQSRTAFFVRDGITLIDIKRRPSGPTMVE